MTNQATQSADHGRNLEERLPMPDRYVLEAFPFESRIRARLYRYTRNCDDVDELLQEMYVRLLTLGARDRPVIGSFEAFVMTVARNIASDWLRHQKVVSITLVADLDAETAAAEGQPDELASIEEELGVLADIVDSMPPRQRQVFRLRKVYGLSQKEIARKLGISENTVEQHLTKVVRQVGQLFGHRCRTSALLSQARKIKERLRGRSYPSDG